ncbi:MAG TPA: ABC transporter ATP-binding protein [Phycisphaerales bacterium]|nr:ABC transporter ATP-binding protein [Phycisphaerales bacterium]
MLELIHVSKDYESPLDGQATHILRDVNLKVDSGRSLAIVGPSGSGKSTLLNIIGALDRPTSGEVRLDGEDLGHMTDAQLARIRNKRIGFVFQLHHLLPQCTVLENVLVPTLADPAGASREARDRAMTLLDRVSLADKVHHRPGELSGGQRQRVAVVRALINRPALLLADEPTGSLDKATASEIADLLVDLNRTEGTALIVVTHSGELAAHMERVRELIAGVLHSEAGL